MKSFFIVFLFVAAAIGFPSAGNGASIAEKLKGRILLQVEGRGEAWYVHPATMHRYYLGRPDDAFRVMREQGLGITDSDLSRIARAEDHGSGDSAFAKKLVGRILLQVQARGEAWYVNPLDLKRYYLGRPADAFAIMRSFGLGIANSDLKKISKEEIKKEMVVVVQDGHQRISPIVYDAFKKHFAYVIKKSDGEAVIYDGKEQKPSALIFRHSYPLVPKLIFSPNGERLMYGGRSLGDGKAVFIVDGKEIFSTYEDIEAFGFSPDSQHTYIIQLANLVKIIDEGVHESDTLYIDGKKYETAFPALRMHIPRFSDGKIVPIYWTGDPKAEMRTLVIGEKKQGEYPAGSGEPIFSVDGTRYAFRSGGVFDKIKKIIVDGKQAGADYEDVESISFSPDGLVISFLGTKNGEKFLVKNGIEQKFSDR